MCEAEKKERKKESSDLRKQRQRPDLTPGIMTKEEEEITLVDPHDLADSDAC
jgi:hypothetical protein